MERGLAVSRACCLAELASYQNKRRFSSVRQHGATRLPNKSNNNNSAQDHTTSILNVRAYSELFSPSLPLYTWARCEVVPWTRPNAAAGRGRSSINRRSARQPRQYCSRGMKTRCEAMISIVRKVADAAAKACPLPHATPTPADSQMALAVVSPLM